jgi:hypothetical protein
MKNQNLKIQEESKKKGLIATFIFHSVALLLALYPMMTMEEPKPKMEAVIVEFDNSSKSEGAKKVKKKVVAKRETRQTAALPKRASKMLTTSEPSDFEVPEIKRPVKVPDAMPEPIPSDAPVSTTKRTSKPLEAPIASKPSVKPAEEVSESADASASEGAIDGAEDGVAENAMESGEGKSDSGSGDSDLGEEGSDGTGFIGGDGILTRKIVKRANINELVKESGIIVIKLCVTRNGVVDYVEFDPSRSTIKNTETVRSALDAMSLYRFERDYSAAKRECGSFQFNIEV